MNRLHRIVVVVGVVAVCIMLAGCATAPNMFQDPNGNVQLGVYADAYNFSARMTNIKVSFDGIDAVNRAFGTSSAGHRDAHYRFNLSPGTHTIHAQANKGGAEAQQTFEVKGHVFIAVYFQPTTAPGGGGLQIKVSHNPISVNPGGGLQ